MHSVVYDYSIVSSSPYQSSGSNGYRKQSLPNLFWPVLLLLPGFFPTGARAQIPIPGSTNYGSNNYTEYIAGNLPLILAAPHGGTDPAPALPNRSYGTFSTDLNTAELSRAIRTACFNRFGRWPHVIICRVPRTKIDCNREITEGAQGNPETEAVWNEYHHLIQMAKDSVSNNYGRGLLLDIHGHGHTLQRLEIGYKLSSATLNKSSLSASDKDSSCVRELANRTRVTFNELIRGTLSLGTLLDLRGYPSVPSLTLPNPGKDGNGVDNDYFSGGFTVDTYGTTSPNPGAINAIQIECNYTNLRDSLSNRAAFATALVDALTTYFPIHLGMRLDTLAAPPILSRFNDQTTDEDQKVGPLPFSLSEALATVSLTSDNPALLGPANAVFVGGDSSRTLSLTPNPHAYGSNALIMLAASNPAGGVATEWFYLTVHPVNDAPVFAPASNPKINPGFNLTLSNPATDVENNVLSYRVLSGLPANATFDSNSGTVSWRPTLAQAGQTYPIVIQVTDNGSNALSTNQTNTVTVAPVQTPTVSMAWSGDGAGSNPASQVKLSIQGQTGPDYILMASTNLTNWSSISTNTPGSFPFVWTDTNSSQYPKRFYQVRLGP
jgi:N-formylglutamate amidohydrolase